MNCGIEELTLGNVSLDMDCFSGTRVKDVEIPDSTSWTEYGDFGGYGQVLHFVKEEPESIFEGVFSGTPMSYARQLEKCRRGECSAFYFCDSLRSLFEKDSLVRPEEIFSEMNDSDLDWIYEDDNNWAVRNVELYGMARGYFTKDEHRMARFFFLMRVRNDDMQRLSLMLPEFEELDAELKAKGVLSEEEKSAILEELEKARLERERARKEFEEELNALDDNPPLSQSPYPAPPYPGYHNNDSDDDEDLPF